MEANTSYHHKMLIVSDISTSIARSSNCFLTDFDIIIGLKTIYIRYFKTYIPNIHYHHSTEFLTICTIYIIAINIFLSLIDFVSHPFDNTNICNWLIYPYWEHIQFREQASYINTNNTKTISTIKIFRRKTLIFGPGWAWVQLNIFCQQKLT